MASSTAPRRGSDVLLTTLDHPGAGVARDGESAMESSGSTRITFFKIHVQGVCEPFAKTKEPYIYRLIPLPFYVFYVNVFCNHSTERTGYR